MQYESLFVKPNNVFGQFFLLQEQHIKWKRQWLLKTKPFSRQIFLISLMIRKYLSVMIQTIPMLNRMDESNTLQTAEMIV